MSRYAGKPFLRLLECYVLEAIGELSEANRMTLVQMEPKLRSTYGVQGTWVDIVASQMSFPPELQGQIRTIWEKNRALAEGAGEVLQPESFAMMFVDKNFPR